MESFAHWLLLSIVEHFDCGRLNSPGTAPPSSKQRLIGTIMTLTTLNDSMEGNLYCNCV